MQHRTFIGAMEEGMEVERQSQRNETPSRSSARFLKTLLADCRKILLFSQSQKNAKVDVTSSARNTGSMLSFRKVLRLSSAYLVTFLFASLQYLFWHQIRPFSWFFFYPAVFVSSWIGGLWPGIVSTFIGALLVWWKFISLEHPWGKDIRYLVSASMYVSMGILLSLIQERLRRANREAKVALSAARIAGSRARETKEQLSRLFEQASDGIFVADTSGRITSVNQAGCRMLGYSCSDVQGKSIFELIALSDVPRLQQAAAQMMEGKTQITEWSLRRRDGTYLPVEVSSRILPDGRWQSFVRDMTELKDAREMLLQSYRANRALSRCNQALIRATDQSSLLQQICEIVVQEAGYLLCWVGSAEHDELKSVKVIAQAGRETGYLDGLVLSWEDNERGRGPTGTCIRTGKTSIIKSIATDSRTFQWRAAALERGYASSIAIPLFIGVNSATEIFGALNIYAAEPDAFDAEELQLLTELANDLSFGITTLRMRAERAKAEAEVRVLNADLEERVIARTAELAEAREREAAIGNRIQQTLLLDPPPVDVPGLRIAALSIPTECIDGDFYIFIKHHQGDLDVIVGDVMGKGTPAALLGAATKAHFLKALSHLMALPRGNGLPEPREVVTLAHAQIVRQLIDLESFVTLCYARINVERQELQIVDCGHTGVLQFQARTKCAKMFHGSNLPLGVREGEIHEQISVSFEPGDLLLFFSDGITEARDQNDEPFGLERLEELVSANAHLDSSEIVEVIRKAVLDFSGTGRIDDDLTSVCIRIEEMETPIAHAEKEIQSDLRRLSEVREFVRTFCSSLPVEMMHNDDVDALELAVHEAASNIMEHAYHGRTDQRIDLEGQAYPGRVSILLYHLGETFDPTIVPSPVLDGTQESGFGLYLMSLCVNEVRYFRDERGRNGVVLTKLLQNPTVLETR